MRTAVRLAFAVLLAAAAAPAPAGVLAQDRPPLPPPAAADEAPPVPGRAPPPADAPPKIAKEIEANLKEFFDKEPAFAKDSSQAVETKGARGVASGKLQSAVVAWNAALGGKTSCMRKMDWWKARLFETLTTRNEKVGFSRVETTYQEKPVTLAVNIPNGYKAKPPATYPVILTVLDKDADPKRTFLAAYGDLLATHLVVAVFEDRLQNDARRMLHALPFLFDTYRADRDRVVLDGLGKGNRFVDELAADSAVFFNGAIFRSSRTLSPLAANLALFPCAAVVPASPPPAVAQTLEGLRRNCPELKVFPPDAPKTLQEWIAALPPRKISDQRQDYTWTTRSVSKPQKWGYWFAVGRTVDSGPELLVTVSIHRDPARNLLELECRNLDAGALLLNDEVFDLDHPLYVNVNGIRVLRVENPERDVLCSFAWDSGFLGNPLLSRTQFVTCIIPFTVPPEARLPRAERDALAAAPAKVNGGGAGAPADPPGGKEPPPTPSGDPAAPLVTWYEDLTRAEAAAAADGRPVLALFAAAGESADQSALDVLLPGEGAKERLSKFACTRIATVAEIPVVVPTVEEVARVEGKDAPLLLALRADDALAGKTPILSPGEKPEEAAARLAKWLDGMLEGAGVKIAEAKPGDPPPANPPTFKAIEEARKSGRPVLVLCIAVGEGLTPSPAEVVSVLEADAVHRRLAAFAVVSRGVKTESPVVLTRAVPVTVLAKDAPVLLAIRKDGGLAGRLAGGTLKPEEAEGALKEWLARMLDATGTKAPVATPEGETRWAASLAEAKEASDLPVLVLCAGVPVSPAGEALEKALAGETPRGMLAAFSCVRLAATATEVVTTLKGPPEVRVGAKEAPVLFALRADESVIGSVPAGALEPAESAEGLLRWLSDMLAKAAEKPAEGASAPPPPRPPENGEKKDGGAAPPPPVDPPK